MYKKNFISIKILLITFFLTLVPADPIRIMPLGDSITYDWVFADITNPRPIGARKAYRSYLSYALTNAGYSFDFVGSMKSGQDVQPPFDSDNEGHTGWTSYEVALDVYSFLVANPADILLVYLGANDLNDNVNGMASLLDQIDAFERDHNMPVRVVLALIADFRDHFPTLEAFNANLNLLALDRIKKGDNIIIADMYTDAGLTQADYFDKVHPNEIGYQKIANMWVNPIMSIRNDRLYLYPIKLVNRQYIQESNINITNNSVTFTTVIPNNGIIF
jgi:hypothetical protein